MPMYGGAGSRSHAAAVNAPLASTTTTPHLNYYGGPLIQHVKIVQVLYGAEDPAHGIVYRPSIKNTVTPNMHDWFSQVTNSPYMDWLSEYNANGHTINRGTYAGTYSITPDAARNGQYIDDIDIQNELVTQINASHLPASDDDTLYMVFFPSNKVITSWGDDSLHQFCAYHGAIGRNDGTHLRYAVLPDTAADRVIPGTNPPKGCGPDDNPWRAMSIVVAHEMIEAITDPDVTLTNMVGWFDPNIAPDGHGWGEIGDICHAVASRIVGTDNVIYSVQREWSNASGRCVTRRIISVGDGSIVEGDSGQRGFRIPVTLSEPSKTNVTVHYTVTGGTATGPGAPAPGVDFDAPKGASGTLTFAVANGFTSVRQSVLIFVNGDTDAEANETFTVTLDSPSNNYSLGRAVGTGTILDDDSVPPATPVRLAVGDSTVAAGGSGVRQLAFPISLSKPVGADIVVHWTVHDGDLRRGVNYLGVGPARDVVGIGVLKAGTTGFTLYVDVRANHLVVAPKQMTVSIESFPLFPLPGWMSLARSTATGTLVPG